MKAYSQIIGLSSLIIGCSLNVVLFTSLINSMIAVILLAVMGVALAPFSLSLKPEKKWIGIAGLVLNLIPLAYMAILFVGLG